MNDQIETYTYITGTNKINEITSTETTSYTHDANGNITNIGNKTLTYNQNKRLIKVEENGTTLGEYTYNGLGQRIIKEAGEVTTVFHYDFNGNIIGESTIDGTFTKEYLYRGKGRSAMVDVASGEIYYFGNDRLGTPQILTDSTNTVVWEGYYKPFGEAEVNPNSSVINNFRFAGQYYDQETGLHYNYHRYYEPRTGRYLTPDPSHSMQPRGNNITYMLPYILNKAQKLNLYLYAQGNPINRTDITGLSSIEPLRKECEQECKAYFHHFSYLGCVLVALGSPDTAKMVVFMFGAAALTSATFTPAAGTGVAIGGGILIGYTIGSKCGKYATFCDEKGPGPMPFL